MTPNNNEYVEIGDLVIIDQGILGKVVYKVTNDFLHIRLHDIDRGWDHEKVFKNLEGLQRFIDGSTNVKLVSLH